ncbi:hypothetical protein K437DRAFT_253512 [Tilletiaria anomala UBC 951]|uniref:Uncharacterized protein n=1 Tax=Tilletiaria anomala (strain ATCC 24038 / CBS 436.72 / UBC 951) TaxID=1037660 RepID=A0A066WG23_TILAU|nr:uncharacterized protein K437DRAFT_253512 [Tilletiaria anomala UBC 951]KDN52902.1 hypothetical protein K437DRAFT_253512 [Tilletiaria anomala UBC 951]
MQILPFLTFTAVALQVVSADPILLNQRDVGRLDSFDQDAISLRRAYFDQEIQGVLNRRAPSLLPAPRPAPSAGSKPAAPADTAKTTPNTNPSPKPDAPKTTPNTNPNPKPDAPRTTTNTSSSTKIGVDKSENNSGSAKGNQGTISNSMNNVKEKDTCSIYIGSRDLTHVFDPEGEFQKRESPNPSTLKWTPAKTTTNSQGETFYRSNCYCGCKRALTDIIGTQAPLAVRGVQIADIHARAMIAQLESGCSIVGEGPSDTKRWKGACDTSTLGGQPVKSVLQAASAKRAVATKAELQPGCSIVTNAATGKHQWTGSCDASTLGGKPITSALPEAA